MKEFKSDLKRVGSLFGNEQVHYRIPLLQRRYVWDEDKIQELLDDIEQSFLKDRASQYFIGGMVLAKSSEDELIVVDGQQRLTTISLILAAAREYFRSEKDEEFAIFLEKNLWSKFQDPSSGEIRDQYYVKLQTGDDPVFQKLIAGAPVVQQLTVSQKNMVTNLQTAREYISKLEAPKPFIYYLLNKVHVVVTIAEDQTTAFQIFETLNYRGAQLQPEDLLKNLLLQSVDEGDYDHFSDKWQSILERLMKSTGNYVVTPTSFLKHFIMSKGHYRGKTEVYDWFREQVWTRQQVLDLLEELDESAKNYRAFTEGKPNAATRAMRLFGVRQGYIILLAGLRLAPRDFDHISRAMERVAFVYALTGRKTNHLEERFCQLAAKIREGTPEAVESSTADLNALADAHKAEVLLKIASYQVLTTKDLAKARYMLDGMARALDGGDYSAYTLEHILPQDKASTSSELSDDQYRLLVSQIGNLTLLTKQENSSIKNAVFSGKAPVYAATACRLTNVIAKQVVTGTQDTQHDRALVALAYAPASKWDDEEIRRRSASLSRLAEHIWF